MAVADRRGALAAAEDKGIAKGVIIGRAEGREEGKIEEQLKFAKFLLENNYPLDSICNITNLPIDKIINLQNKK